jgi:hypothetical protein
MLRFGKEFGCTPPRERVSGLMYNLAFSTLCEHLVIPSASNSHFKPRQLVECPLYLSVEGRYAESGLEGLACTCEAPSADTLLYRLKKVKSHDAYEMLIQVNDSIIEELRSKGVFRRPVVAAIVRSRTMVNTTASLGGVGGSVVQTSATHTHHYTKWGGG